MQGRLRNAVGLLAGLTTAIAMAAAATLLARSLWPDYAAAEQAKAYSLAMLVARLSVGALGAAGGAGVASVVAGDKGQTALWLGWLYLAASLPVHLFKVWDDYPPWYHLVYLGYLVPVAWMTGRIIRVRSQHSPIRTVA